jgi:hypothetical protein
MLEQEEGSTAMEGGCRPAALFNFSQNRKALCGSVFCIPSAKKL